MNDETEPQSGVAAEIRRTRKAIVIMFVIYAAANFGGWISDVATQLLLTFVEHF